MGMVLNVYQLPPDKVSQQHFIDQAEEDLLCAYHFYQHGVYEYEPLVTICYLFHQSIEKWIKAMNGVCGGKAKKTHDLTWLFDRAIEKEPALFSIRDELNNRAEELLEENYPDILRYRESDRYKQYNVENQASVLIAAAFETRRIVKRRIKQQIEQEAQKEEA